MGLCRSKHQINEPESIEDEIHYVTCPYCFDNIDTTKQPLTCHIFDNHNEDMRKQPANNLDPLPCLPPSSSFTCSPFSQTTQSSNLDKTIPNNVLATDQSNQLTVTSPSNPGGSTTESSTPSYSLIDRRLDLNDVSYVKNAESALAKSMKLLEQVRDINL